MTNNKRYSSCPACGGTMHFDVGLQKIKCDYCDSVFDPDALGEMRGADEQTMSAEEAEYFVPGQTPAYEAREEEVTIFSCPSCGAQVVGEDVAAVEYCQYCGNFVTFTSRLEKIRRPDYIAPFSIDRELCEKIYRHRVSSTPYVPKDLKDGQGRIEFHPMFIPFWNMEVEYPERSSIHTSENWREGNYKCSRDYDIEFESEGRVTNCIFDASLALDDHISDCIGDYDPAKLVDYNPTYMQGAYADMADVTSDAYEEEAKERCFNAISGELRRSLEDTGEAGKLHDHKTVSLDYSDSIRSNVSARLSMFPVWFMTYKNRDRVAYSVINGQTGSIFTETPVDLKKFFIVSLILAVPIFLLLEAFFTFRPYDMLRIVSIITSVVLIIYAHIIGEEWARDNGARPSGIKNRLKKLNVKKTGIAGVLFGLFIIYLIAFVVNLFIFTDSYVPLIVSFRVLVFLLALSNIAGQFKKYDRAGKRRIFGEIICGVIAVVITIVFRYYDPVHDWYYYVAAIASVAGMIVSIGFLMKRYNRRVTHPIPHFFNERDGGIS